MHPVKELHIFDTLHGLRSQEALHKFSAAQLARLDRHFHSPSDSEIQGLPKRIQCEYRSNRILLNSDVNNIDYADLFRPLLMHGTWLGEITPEYMLLNPDQIRDVVSRLGARVVFVLMIRNPVKRFISAFRLRHAYMRPQGEAPPSNEALNEDFRHIFKSQDGWFQTQLKFNEYKQSVENYQSVVGSDLLFFSLDELVERVSGVATVISQATGLSFDEEKVQSVVSEKANEVNVPFRLDADSSHICSSYFSDLLQSAEDLVGHRLVL